jgi:hypothetical protein
MNGFLQGVVSAVLVAASSARPAELPAVASRASAISLTVSGGVSLGAYEAGFLSYAIAGLRRGDAPDLRILTGASAGSLNALLAVLASCGAAQADSPADTLFWKVWIPVGFEQLSTETASPLGAFSREWLLGAAAQVEQAWDRGIDASCDVVLGVSTTRVEPRILRTAGGRLELPRMEEKFVIRVQGRGPGLPPRASNYVPATGPVARPLLVTDDQGEIAFSELRDLLFASTAFPVAFAPQALRTCVAGETSRPGVCLAKDSAIATYVDGGIFDNAPLRMAVGIARGGLERSDADPRRLQWRAVPDADGASVPDGIVFAFVNPSAAEYPSPRVEAKPEGSSLFGELAAIAGALVETARAKELAVLVEERPDIADRLLVPRRRFPAASAPLFAFLGFFETEFRVFDFHLGMYDARRLVADLASRAEAAQPPPGAGMLRSERFACMAAVYDGDGDPEEACRGDALADFRALLQVSLDQLYDACRASGPPAGAPRWTNAHRDRAATGAQPPRVPGLSPTPWRDWRRRTGEPELAYSMRLLAAYGFGFEDLGVPRGHADLAVARIRAAISRAGDRLAVAQPLPYRPAAAFAAKLAADSVAYAPPRWTLHLSMGPTESELGLSHGFPRTRWLPAGIRLAVAVGFRGLEGAFTSGGVAPFGTLLVGGVEVQPPGNSAFSQLRLGVRGGWLLAADDRSGARACADRGAGHVSACTRPVTQAVVGYSLLERFRIQLVGEWFPGTAHRADTWSLGPGIGLELGF